MEQQTTDQSGQYDDLTAVVSIVDRFEEAWKQGLAPEIERYLPVAGSPHRQRVLRELVHIDLDYRLRAERDARIKEYHGRYPDMPPTWGGRSLAEQQRSVQGRHDPVVALTRSIAGGGGTAPERRNTNPTTTPGVGPEATRLDPARTQDESQSSDGFVLASVEALSANDRGRYSLVGMHAEGGIGQVWKARDRDLDRDVALKKLQPAAAVKAPAQARFLREARITGRLQHPGIVPVYELCQSGAGSEPFYTMRLIKGRTLTEAIEAYHQSRRAGQASPLDLRELVGALLSACQTIAYAHSRGVLHRDIKGSNVVLGDFGEVMVIDWGLAKIIGEPEAEPGPEQATTGSEAASLPIGSRDQTIEGEILGTPNYMAPEQAEGRIERIDPRSDVYGLGGILYEILTGEPPFRGGLAEVLRKVVDEPPIPPGQRVAGLSPALVGICMKCLAKDPEDRYASAADLAKDIQRYLADEPVRAFAEPWTFKVRRWVGRHRTLATASAAALLVATASLAMTTLFLERANSREALARTRAEQNLLLAREVVDRFFTKVSEDPRMKALGLEKLRRELLLDAKKYFERFFHEEGHEPQVEAERGRNFLRLAKITEDLGEPGEATMSSRQAQSIFTALSQQHPASPEYRAGLAEALDSLGGNFSGNRQLAEAKQAFEEAVSVWEGLARDYPAQPVYPYRVARTLNRLDRLLCLQLLDTAQGLTHLSRSLSICRQLVEKDSGASEYRDQLAEAMLIIGHVRSSQEFDQIKGMLEEALEIREKLVADEPNRPDYEAGLVDACVLIATSYSNARVPGRVQSIYEKVRRIGDTFAREHPHVPLFVENHYLIEMLYSHTLSLSGDHARATAVAEESVAAAPRSGLVILYAACCYTIASESARRDQQLAPMERERRAEQHLARAMELLRAAKATGLFEQPWYLSGIKTDPDLVSLRGRQDFQAFVRELEGRGSEGTMTRRGPPANRRIPWVKVTGRHSQASAPT